MAKRKSGKTRRARRKTQNVPQSPRAWGSGRSLQAPAHPGPCTQATDGQAHGRGGAYKLVSARALANSLHALYTRGPGAPCLPTCMP